MGESYPAPAILIAFPWLQTIGAAFVAKVMSVGDRTVTLGIWVSPLGRWSWENPFLRSLSLVHSWPYRGHFSSLDPSLKTGVWRTY